MKINNPSITINAVYSRLSVTIISILNYRITSFKIKNDIIIPTKGYFLYIITLSPYFCLAIIVHINTDMQAYKLLLY